MGYEFIKNLKYLTSCFLDLIYNSGEECIACGEYANSKSLLCERCNSSIKLCNKSFEITIHGHSMSCYSSFYYSGLGKELIGRLKYKSDFRAGDALVEYMLYTIKFNDVKFDTVTYVPCSKATMKKRGYNQSQYLAKKIGHNTNTKVLTLLKKIKHTKDQIGLSGEERWENLQGAFLAINENEIKNKKILLVDDVITTGATAFYCSRLMMEKGAVSVCILTGAKSSI
ncbi:ComF family protein [Clostridium bovifaecis]|uniref:ComF family protein n=1 Tax=Clostridium bovifaecis TaxID=2184719 RepID=A0A6I6F8T5_9CLOT|nr:ComF family protein [Clostridium bovifaecis]